MSSGPQKAAKYCQIFAASPSRKLLSASGRGGTGALCLPRPGTAKAAASQTRPKARPDGAGESRVSARPVKASGQGSRALRARPSDWAAVCQARRFFFETPMRQRARAAAPRQVRASQGSSRARSRICSRRPVAPCGTSELRRSRSRRKRAKPSAGSRPVHSEQAASSPAQSEAAEGRQTAQTIAARQKGAKRLRRRLSKSFQRSAKAKFRPRRRMKEMFCQSPRTQRCRRRK